VLFAAFGRQNHPTLLSVPTWRQRQGGDRVLQRIATLLWYYSFVVLAAARCISYHAGDQGATRCVPAVVLLLHPRALAAVAR